MALTVPGRTQQAFAAPPAPAPAAPLAASAEGRALQAAWEQAQYRFTPAVKTAHLAWAKAWALATIAKAGQRLPDDFLAWVDGDPVVAATVYGIATNGAQRLVLLRSLELDLGAGAVRGKHTQLALGLTDAYAGTVNLETLSPANLGISLQERALLKVEIKRYPCVRVDTRPGDRPLDLNDHIINFLEDHPVVTTNKVVKEENGRKIETLTTNSRPLHAWEVYSNPERLKTFNAYMTARGFQMDLDCGNGSIVPRHWGGGRDITAAYKLFRTAYEEKGRLPRRSDPAPTPAEKAAYLIRNDNYRFPEGVKRNWPRFPLNAPWPVLDYLVRGGESLREREFVWDRFVATGSVVGYGAYIGQIAQYPDLVKARRLQPFDFAYDTYPMRLKDGGVCGTCSNIGRFSHIGLGVPAAQASQPAHSCFVAVGGSEAKGFGLSIGQSVAGPGSTSVSGRGPYIGEAIKFYPINYGLAPWLDARMVLLLHGLLPRETPAERRLALLRSGLDLNPYALPIAKETLAALADPRAAVEFWQGLEKTLAAVEKPGCPKTGYYNNAVVAAVDARLAQLPLPPDKAARGVVLAYLESHADALWLKYQADTLGLPGLQEQLAAELSAGLEGGRTPEAVALLARRITLTGAAVKDAEAKRGWANQLLAKLEGREVFTTGSGKTLKSHTDPCAVTLRELAGSTPETRAAFAEALRKAVEGGRSAASCNLLADRLNVLAKLTTDRKVRPVFAAELIAIINGREMYVPDPKRPAAQALDPSAPAIYALGGDLAPVKTRLAADLQAAMAGARTPDACLALNARLAALVRNIRNAQERKAWAEELLKVVAGHESYVVNAGDPKKAKELPDPCAVQVYQLAGQKTPAQLKAEEARLQAAEAKRKAAQPLTIAEKARQDLSAQEKAREAGP